MLAALDEEEAYLYAILSDETGLDQAEFLWHDSENDDGVWRAFDFQWPWYANTAAYQVDQGARATGKTVGITLRACSFAFVYGGQQMLITAPELNHLKPLVSAIEERLNSHWLYREMRPSTKGMGVTRNPHWECKFQNGSKLVSRIPQRDGRGVKGQHVIQIELDEAQDYPLAGWIEVVETLNRFLPGAAWRCHGVPRGVRDRFYEITSGENSEWTVHRPMAMNRPSWSPAEREEKIQIYGGSRQAPDYKRNILGEHGDATNPLFVLARLMANVDTDQGSEYNTDVYYSLKLSFEKVGQTDILSHLEFPAVHKTGWGGAKKGYSAFYAGMDVGATVAPSEILVFGRPADAKTDVLHLLTRVNLQRISMEDQEKVVDAIIDWYKPQTFGLDRTGIGFTIWERLTKTHGDVVMRGYAFNEKRAVALEDRPLERGEKLEDLVIERDIKEHSSDSLREYVDAKRFLLPFDREVLQEWQGQQYVVVKTASNPYGKRDYSAGKFHTLDAARMMVAAKDLAALEAMLTAKPTREPVLDVFIGAG